MSRYFTSLMLVLGLGIGASSDAAEASWGRPHDTTWYRVKDNAHAVFHLYYQPSIAREIVNHGRGPLLMLAVWSDGDIVTLDATKEGGFTRHVRHTATPATVTRFLEEIAKLGFTRPPGDRDFRSLGLSKPYMQMSVIKNQEMVFWTSLRDHDHWRVKSAPDLVVNEHQHKVYQDFEKSWHEVRVLAGQLLIGDGKAMASDEVKWHRPSPGGRAGTAIR